MYPLKVSSDVCYDSTMWILIKKKSKTVVEISWMKVWSRRARELKTVINSFS